MSKITNKNGVSEHFGDVFGVEFCARILWGVWGVCVCVAISWVGVMINRPVLQRVGGIWLVYLRFSCRGASNKTQQKYGFGFFDGLTMWPLKIYVSTLIKDCLSNLGIQRFCL